MIGVPVTHHLQSRASEQVLALCCDLRCDGVPIASLERADLGEQAVVADRLDVVALVEHHSVPVDVVQRLVRPAALGAHNRKRRQLRAGEIFLESTKNQQQGQDPTAGTI